METQATVNVETVNMVTIKPGANLREKRQALGLTEDEVAIQLHLSRSIIDAIEADAFEKLYGPTFVRGYLRAYAKLLNLSPDDVIQTFNLSYPDLSERAPTSSHKYQSMIIKQKRQTESSVKWVGYGICVAMVILVLIWWHNHSTVLESTTPKSTSAFQTPNNNKTVKSTNSTPATQPLSSSNGSSMSAMPVIGPGNNSQNQMTVTNPIAATVSNAAQNMPGMQTDDTMSSVMMEQANQKAIDVNQATANAAAVPGLAPTNSVSDVPNMTSTKTRESVVWHDPDNN